MGLIPDDKPLNVFTLNYDGVLEILCEKNDIYYYDGFGPTWDTNGFDEEKYGLRIYKLHGSLYWLKSNSGKIIRVPIKGINTDDIRYLPDDSLSEMMIYPALQKEKYTEVYSGYLRGSLARLMILIFVLLLDIVFVIRRSLTTLLSR